MREFDTRACYWDHSNILISVLDNIREITIIREDYHIFICVLVMS